jgi:WD40 repeat protein
LSGDELIVTSKMTLRHSVTCLDANDGMMAFGDDTGRITIWHHSANRIQTLHWHSGPVNSLKFLPCQQLLSGGMESVLVLWRISDQHRQFLPKIGEAITHVAIKPDFRQFAVCTKGNKIALVDAASLRESRTIEGIAGLGSSRDGMNRVVPFSDTVIVNVGSVGCLQAFDVARDQSVFSLPAIDLLLTDPSGQSDSPNVPVIESFTVSEDGEWIVSAEGRRNSSPHLGYIKMWAKATGGSGCGVGGSGFTLHTVTHNPHTGPVSDLAMALCNGRPVLCSVSDSDTFKLYSLEMVYDSAQSKHRPSWRVLYADPLNGRPSSCAIHPCGHLAISYGSKVVVLDVLELLSGTLTMPRFLNSANPSPRHSIKRMSWLSPDVLIACTALDLFSINVHTLALRQWSVTNHALSVRGGRVAILSTRNHEHWLLEFDSDLQVTNRKQIDGPGRAVLLLEKKGIMWIHSDAHVFLSGNDDCDTSTNTMIDRAVKEPRKRPANILMESLQSPAIANANAAIVKSAARAKPVKSRSYLYPLVRSQELPPIVDIFRAFIVPRIQG